jgi:acetyl esterase/lipase
MVETAARLLGHQMIFSKDTEQLRVYLEKRRGRPAPPPPRWIQRRCALRTELVRGRPLYVIGPAAQRAEKRAVLFIHGGGFITEAESVHWRAAARIVDALGITVWFPAYPLLSGKPDGNWSASGPGSPSMENICEMIQAVYGLMLDGRDGGDIVFLGDSAGAALALSFCHRNKARGLPQPMPRRLVLVSPAMVTERDPAILAAMRAIDQAKMDALLSMTLLHSLPELLGLDMSRDNFYSAPLYGDFSGFPAMDVFAGDRDICFPQAPPFVERVRQAGVPVKLHHGRGMMHVWPYMPLAPECAAALQRIIAIIGEEPVPERSGGSVKAPV